MDEAEPNPIGGDEGNSPQAAMEHAQAAVNAIEMLVSDPEALDPAVFQMIQTASEKLKTKNESDEAARHEGDGEADPTDNDLQGDAPDQPLLGDAYSSSSEDELDDDDVLLEQKRMVEPWSDIKLALVLSAIMTAILITSTIVFYYLERDQGWTIIDAWYFTVVTVNTVGYGVLVPSSDLSRIVVIIFIVFGMAFSVFTMTFFTEICLRRIEAFSVEHRLHTYTPIGPAVIAISIIMLLMIFLGTIYGTMWEGWSFVESLYFTIVTISTVGYGDYTPTTSERRLVISFYTLVVGGVYLAISGYSIGQYIELRRRAVAINFLFSELTPEAFADIRKDERGFVGRKAFMEYMLVQMGYCDERTIMMVDDCFDAMDAEGDEQLSVGNIVSSEEGRQFLRYMRKRHGIESEDVNPLPFGFFGLKMAFKREEKVPDHKLTAEERKRKLAHLRKKAGDLKSNRDSPNRTPDKDTV